MEYTYSTQGHTGIFALKGNLIHADGALELVESLDLRFSEGMRKFVIDLSRMDHVNSSGLGVFITLKKKCDRHGAELTFAAPSQYLMQLFLITKLNQILPVAGTVEEAIAAQA